MPDAPIANTPTIGLAQWAEGANPGFAALNTNWDLIDAAILDLQNTILTLTAALEADVEALEAADVTLQDNIDAALSAAEGYALAGDTAEAAARIASDNTEASTRSAADVAEAATRAAADLLFLLLDGTRKMTGDLDMDSHKIKKVTNGVADDEAVNVGQLNAAIAATEGLFGIYEYCQAHASADLVTGTSPRTFEADTNDEITDGDMHSTSSNKDRFVAQQDALYEFKARFKVDGWYSAGVQWYKNGVLIARPAISQFLPAVGSNITFLQDDLWVNLDAGDYVTAEVFGLAMPDSGTILAGSSIQMLAVIANGVGGGDFFADGHVPLTGDIDGGGNEAINFADGASATSLATVGQVDDLVDAAITAADIPGQVAAEVASELTTARILQVEDPGAIALFDTVAAHNVFQDITGATKTFNLPYAQRVDIAVDAFNIDDGSNNVSGQLRIHVTDSLSAVTTKDGPAVNGGNDVNYAPFGMKWWSGVLPAGSTTVKIQVRNPTSNSRTRTQVTNFQVGYFN